LPITIAFTFLKAFKKKYFPLQLISITGPQGHGTSSTLQLKIVPFYVFYYKYQ
jgi:hypothetical protein